MTDFHKLLRAVFQEQSPSEVTKPQPAQPQQRLFTAPKHIPPLAADRRERIIARTLNAVRTSPDGHKTETQKKHLPDAEKEVYPIMAKRPNPKRTAVTAFAAVAAVIIIFFGGLWLLPRLQGTHNRNDVPLLNTGSVPTEASEKDSPNLDVEIQAAIDAHEIKTFFMLNGDTREMPEGLSIWTCSRLNCTQLWPELRNQLFPEAEGGTEARPGEGGSMYELTVDGKTVEVTVSPNVIGFSFVSSKRAKDFAEKLADVMTEKTGAGISDHAEEHFSNRRFAATAELNGLPLDLHFIGDDGFPQLCGIYQLGKEIYLSNPIGELLSSEAVSSESLLTLDDLEVTVEFESEIKKETFTKTVTVYDRCESVFRFDEKSGTLRPTWRASGNRFIYWVDSGKTTTEHAELLVDALTGEMFSVEE